MTPIERRLLSLVALYICNRDRGTVIDRIRELRKTLQREMGNQPTTPAADLKPGHVHYDGRLVDLAKFCPKCAVPVRMAAPRGVEAHAPCPNCGTTVKMQDAPRFEVEHPKSASRFEGNIVAEPPRTGYDGGARHPSALDRTPHPGAVGVKERRPFTDVQQRLVDDEARGAAARLGLAIDRNVRVTIEPA